METLDGHSIPGPYEVVLSSARYYSYMQATTTLHYDVSRRRTRDGDLRSPAARELATRTGGLNEGRRNLIAAAYASLDGEPSPVPLPTFEDGLRHVRFAAAALESARRGVWVDLR